MKWHCRIKNERKAVKRAGLFAGKPEMRADYRLSDFPFLERGKFFHEAVTGALRVAKSG